jgi:hypothetical protein
VPYEWIFLSAKHLKTFIFRKKRGKWIDCPVQLAAEIIVKKE